MLLGRLAVEMLFGFVGLGFRAVNDAVAMLGRSVKRVKPQRLVAGVDHVVTRAGGDDHREIGFDVLRDGFYFVVFIGVLLSYVLI